MAYISNAVLQLLLGKRKYDRVLSSSRSLSLATFSTPLQGGCHQHYSLWISTPRDVLGTLDLLALYALTVSLHLVKERVQ